jgi:hypothetical protein
MIVTYDREIYWEMVGSFKVNRCSRLMMRVPGGVLAGEAQALASGFLPNRKLRILVRKLPTPYVPTLPTSTIAAHALIYRYAC